MNRFVVAASALALCASGAGASTFLLSGLDYDFGDVHVGDTTSEQVVTLTNTSDIARQFALAGGAPANRDFSAVQTCAGRELAPGDSCEFRYRFTPSQLGETTGSSVLTIDGETRTVNLRGTGLLPYQISARTLDFGTISSGKTSNAQSVFLTNVSQSTRSFALTGGAPANREFSAVQNCAGRDLAPGESCAFTYRYTPEDDGASTGSSVLTVDGDTVSIDLTGAGGDTPSAPFLVSGLDLHFADEHVGDTSAAQEVRITNVSDQTLSPGFTGGAPANRDFGATQNCAGKTFAPGDSCAFFFRYAPSDLLGDVSFSNFTIDGVPYQIALNGRGGLDPFLISKLSLDFGMLELGKTSPEQMVWLTNVSQTAQVFQLVGGAPANRDFSATQSCAGRELAPGESCAFNFRFTPSAEGLSEGTSVLTINGKQVTIALMGSGPGGTAPPPALVPLPATWPLLGLGLLALGGLRRGRAAQT